MNAIGSRKVVIQKYSTLSMRRKRYVLYFCCAQPYILFALIQDEYVLIT